MTQDGGGASGCTDYTGPRLYYFASEADARKLTSEGIDESKGFIDLTSVSNIHLVEEPAKRLTSPWAPERGSKEQAGARAIYVCAAVSQICSPQSRR